MHDITFLSFALSVGFVLGVGFFGGLWWTVRKGLTSAHPALWFLGSMLLRTGIAMAGFYLVAQGDWRKFIACLLGFLIARGVVTLLTRMDAEAPHAA